MCVCLYFTSIYLSIIYKSKGIYIYMYIYKGIYKDIYIYILLYMYIEVQLLLYIYKEVYRHTYDIYKSKVYI